MTGENLHLTNPVFPGKPGPGPTTNHDFTPAGYGFMNIHFHKGRVEVWPSGAAEKVSFM